MPHSTSPFRQPDHPAITEALIARVVDDFYSRVRKDPRLGPLFETHMSASWEVHLTHMRAFWSSILLKTGAYKGQPMPMHKRLNQEVIPADFSIWLGLFRATVTEHCAPDVAACFLARAERIAESLQIGMFFQDQVVPAHAFHKGVLQEPLEP